MITYAETYNALNENICIIIFIKSNGEYRTMLGTRDVSALDIIDSSSRYKLNMIDGRCNINNNNIGVIDLVINEARSFKVGRMLYFQRLGKIRSIDEFDKLYKYFKDVEADYMSRAKTEESNNSVDGITFGNHEQNSESIFSVKNEGSNNAITVNIDSVFNKQLEV